MIPSYFMPIMLIGSFLGILAALVCFITVKRKCPGNAKMQEIASYIKQGAIGYLKQQYKIVAITFIFLAMLFAYAGYVLKIQSTWTWFAFLTGGFFSGLSGFCGMITSTYAAVRVAEACRKSLNSGLRIAIMGGAVLGLVVVGLALFDIAIWFWILDHFIKGDDSYNMITMIMITFGMGASTQALFARLGGGIYTKGADVGADLVGKVEAGIPEDDPRNPATIADNVGDNVGDINGMGADLYESYAGSILATCALGSSAVAALGKAIQIQYIMLPLILGIVGLVLSIIGIFLIRIKEDASMKQIVSSMNRAVMFVSVLIVMSTFGITYFMGIKTWMNNSLSVLFGIVGGVLIGLINNYYTSSDHSPTRNVARSALTSPASVILSGLSVGMKSTASNIISVCGVLFLSYYFGSENFQNMSMGLYNVGLASLGMLLTLALILTMDAYGPIADNAGGISEMAGLPPEVRERTDNLDAAGNTTAAIGKGFAIGSAALTAIILLAAYIEEVKIALIRSGQTILELAGAKIQVSAMTIADVVAYYEIHALNPKFLLGSFIGGMMIFVFCGIIILSVNKVAEKIVATVRKTFENPLILEGKEIPNYSNCVKIALQGAQKEMILPASIAIVVPIMIGVMFGVAGVVGLLIGGIVCGVPMAIFMANAGGSWDNAKKYIEKGMFGGKKSLAHIAAIVGDTVGDPFKDTCGPCVNILIKLMSMVSIITVGLCI